MMAEPREQVVGQALADRHRIAKHLADGAFDKALEVALERLKVDADDVDAHELAFDVLVAAGQEELARAQLGHLMEVAVLRSDVGRARRFVHELEHIEPEHPSLPAARELISQARLVETDSTLLDEALRSVL
jgi:thioredoxin-like negative regulator of GroEL